LNYFEYLESKKNITLSERQKAAVSHDEGPGLVLSTAGSGKTTVITARAGKLIFDGHLKGDRILTITFSKLAAQEMKIRFRRLFPEIEEGLTRFSTIHAFAYKIVRDYSSKTNKELHLLSSNFDILKKIMAGIYSQNGIYQVSVEEVENLSSKISFVKNMKISQEAFSSKSIGIRNFSEMYGAYEAYKQENKALDFDDMLVYCDKILRLYPNVADSFKSFYRYIQLDEAQDTSLLQYGIIEQISNGNLFMVGDDDQSIYSFRGSHNQEMLQFKDKYSKGRIYTLDINYRCDGHIVSSARRFIESNKLRYEKNIEAFHEKKHEMIVKSFPTRRNQAAYIISKILEEPQRETAILYRYNISALMMAENLRKQDIGFFIKEDRNRFFNSTVLRDVIAFFKLALDPTDKNAFGDIYYKSQTYFTREMNAFVAKGGGTVYNRLYQFPNLDKLKVKNITNFKYNMKQLSTMNPEDALEFIRFEMGYEDYLNRLEKDGRLSFSSMFLDLEIIKEICRNSSSIHSFILQLESLKQVLRESKENTGARVILSSIHGTKGLEFDRVFMIDNIYGEFPLDKRNQTQQEYDEYYEEERRIFYVAMTRAKKNLEILYPETPSDFVSQLRKTIKIDSDEKFSVGMKVAHAKFGVGMIVEMNQDEIVFRDKKGKNYRLDKDILAENHLLEILN